MARTSFPFFLCLFLLAEVLRLGYIRSNHRRLWSARRTANDTFFLFFRNLDVTGTSALGASCAESSAFVKHIRKDKTVLHNQKNKPLGLNDAHKVNSKMGSRTINASSTTSDDKKLKDTPCTRAIFFAGLAGLAGWTTRLVGSGTGKGKGKGEEQDFDGANA